MQYPKLVESKTSTNEVITIEWNPGMDLLATVFSNEALTCSRLLSLQKVWTKQPNGRIISTAWRPDGRVLAVGVYNDKTKENLCILHDVENGQEINTISKERAITSIAWFQYTPLNEDKNETESKLANLHLSSPKSTPSIADVNEKFSHKLAHEQSQLNILIISTEDGKVSVYALGLFYIGDLPIQSESNSKISKIHMSTCLSYITTVIHSKHSNNIVSSIKIMKLDTYQKRSKEILRVAKMYAKITDELEYLDDTISAITTSWVDVLAGLDNKLSSYCSRKNKKSNDEVRGGYTFLGADELLQLLIVGFPSDNLEKFLTDMSDKGLKKLNNAIEQTCMRVQNLIVKNAQKCCYHLHKDLNLLRGMALWRDRFAEVGLDDKCIVDAMQSVGSLMLKLTELQQVIDHSLRSTKSFFRWLISIACRMTGEQNNSTIQNDINKTTQQHIQLIIDFILENFDYNTEEPTFVGMSLDSLHNDSTLASRPTCSNFTLEQVGQYLKCEPLSRLKYSFAKPGSNFWIDFLKERPHLTKTSIDDNDGSSVLLFYPHNPDTSLIQEHKSAKKSIETAFKSVAENIKLVCENDNLIHLKDFVRGAPTNRIRVETDTKSMKHYTLFQTKPDSVHKQYLISQHVEDRTFKLISIEFQSIPQKSGGSTRTISPPNLLIADSNFYENKETRVLQLNFLLLDKMSEDTVLLMIDMDKIIENSNSIDRHPKDITKVFRNNDSIDRFSSQVILKLDLYTEPARERHQDLGAIVKKIKGTSGKDMFSSSGRGMIAFTSSANKRLHLYELEAVSGCAEIVDDEFEGDDRIDESLIETELVC